MEAATSVTRAKSLVRIEDLLLVFLSRNKKQALHLEVTRNRCKNSHSWPMRRWDAYLTTEVAPLYLQENAESWKQVVFKATMHDKKYGTFALKE
jgi:hypothetical protein